jgi:hypothetical protein
MECVTLSFLFIEDVYIINFWEGYSVMETAGELRGNHNIHYFVMLLISNKGSWHAPVTSVRSIEVERIRGLHSSGMRCGATS